MVTKEEFELYVKKVAEDHWHWTGPRTTRDNAPYLWLKKWGRSMRATRLGWWLYCDEGTTTSFERDLIRVCDDPECISPFHRQPMTRKEGKQGSRHGRAKLTEEDVIEILDRLERGESQTSIAKIYGVSQPKISQIANRKAWTHVE